MIYGRVLMSNSTDSEAIKADYARANNSEIAFITLSLRHNGLVDLNGNATELYVYRGGEAEGYEAYGDSEVAYRDCIIEGNNPINGGQIARFIELPFELKLPDENTKAGSRAQLSIANVNHEISEFARKALDNDVKIYITFRGYIVGSEKLSIEQQALEFEVKNIELSGIMANIEMIIPLGNLHKSYFPKAVWNMNDHPWLKNRAKKIS